MHRAIVTGGTRGAGRAVATAIAAAGGSVMITGLDRARLDAAVREIGASVGETSRVRGLVADVRDRSAVDAVVAETVRAFGGVDVLVNNAAVGVFGPVASITDEDWHRVLDTNLNGPFYCTRAVIPELRRAGGGWVISIASLAAKHPFPRGAAYCASKAALVAFSESLMEEVRFENIRVAVVLPGSIATEFNGHPVRPEDDWKLAPGDIADVVMDLLRHPARSMPTRVEVRPSKPPKKA
jgi:NAD(P)-dependent dehydrogenase (short-subunit alcohol dehydrogenase family)